MVTLCKSVQEFYHFIERETHQIDCLILQDSSHLPPLLAELQRQAILFPTIVVETVSTSAAELSATRELAAQTQVAYHSALVYLSDTQLHQIGLAIDQAIGQFIQLSSSHQSAVASSAIDSVERSITQQSFSLKAQQIRLAEKLKERLGYLGVYYKRNPQNFLRHMAQPQREELLQQLRQEYRQIILTYFSDEPDLNQKIDNFVNVAFFADVPVSQIVEIHMDLMDEFAKQLKLEGRSEEILLDYRLTLIDTIAHLCEMYRRSIPRES
jgi:circadian clock protein KaiA